MANATTKETDLAEQMSTVRQYGQYFMKARKGEIKLPVSDIEKLSDLFEIFFGERISNKSERVNQQCWVDKKNYNSELIVKAIDGSIYKVYTQVNSNRIKEQLGK